MVTLFAMLDKEKNRICIVLTDGVFVLIVKRYFIFCMNILNVFIITDADIKEIRNNTMPENLSIQVFPNELSAILRIKKNRTFATVNCLTKTFVNYR
ncbi:unnamed protein product [Rotaria magnacalcarata]